MCKAHKCQWSGQSTLCTCFSLFFLPFRELKTILVNVAEQVKKDVNECLVQHGFPQMDDQKAQLLHGQICDLATPGNAFAKLMSKLAPSCWLFFLFLGGGGGYCWACLFFCLFVCCLFCLFFSDVCIFLAILDMVNGTIFFTILEMSFVEWSVREENGLSFLEEQLDSTWLHMLLVGCCWFFL